MDVEKAEEAGASKLEEDEGNEDGWAGRSEEDTLLYPPPTHARYLAARKVLLSICAIDSVSCSGGSVKERSSETFGADDWKLGTVFCKNKARTKPDIRPINNERVANMIATQHVSSGFVRLAQFPREALTAAAIGFATLGEELMRILNVNVAIRRSSAASVSACGTAWWPRRFPIHLSAALIGAAH